MSWAFGAVAGFIFLCLLGWRFGGDHRRTYGSARWSTVFDAFSAGLLKEKGVFAGDLPGGLVNALVPRGDRPGHQCRDVPQPILQLRNPDLEDLQPEIKICTSLIPITKMILKIM